MTLIDLGLGLLLGAAVLLCIYAQIRPKRRAYAPLRIIKNRFVGARFDETATFEPVETTDKDDK
jgi:hypothetical protein